MASPFTFPQTDLSFRELPWLNVTAIPDWRPFIRGDMPTAVRNWLINDGGCVWRCLLYDTDRAVYSPTSQPRTCRNEAWADDKNRYAAGSTCAAVFGLKLAADFATPPAWMTCGWQMHTPSNSPQAYWSPMCTLSAANGVLKVQNDALGIVVGQVPYDRGRWHYWVIEDTLSYSAGKVRVWHQLDLVPDVTKPPTFEKTMATLPPNSNTAGVPLSFSWTKNGLYRSEGSAGQKHEVFLDHPTEAGDVTTAVQNFRARCRPAALGTTPPPAGKTNTQLVAEAKAILDQIKDC